MHLRVMETHVVSNFIRFEVEWSAWKDDYEITSIHTDDSKVDLSQVLNDSVNYDIKLAIERAHEALLWVV